MLQSWFRSPRAAQKRPTSFRPTLESLDQRILPSGNPHFVNASASVNSAGALVVNFKEAGLASGSVETITVEATADVTYASINGGGNHPHASNKVSFVTAVSGSGTFTALQNGNVLGTLIIAAPPAPSDFGVPGQTVVLAEVSYTNISIVDSTSGASDTIPDASHTFFTF